MIKQPLTQKFELRTRIGATTLGNGDIVVTTVEQDLMIRMHDMHRQYRQDIIKSQDQLVRAQLIKMGWTPPCPKVEAAYLESIRAKKL